MTTTEDLSTSVEDFVTAEPPQSADTFQRLIAAIKDALTRGSVGEAARAIQHATLPSLDYHSSQTLLRLFRRLKGRGVPGIQHARIAVLGSYTTDQLAGLIELHLFASGVTAELYRADYGVFRQEVLDPESGLYSFAPDFVLLATSWRDIRNLPEPGDSRQRAHGLVQRECDEWRALWSRIHDRLECQIVQDAFVNPPWRALGNRELADPAGLGSVITHLNLALAENAPPYVVVHDSDHLAAAAGRWRWSDERYFFSAKLPCAPEFLVDYAHSLASVITAQLGLSKKCLVLDLDNTLWGGVVGDDGLAGIRLGHGDPESEAFTAFQQYVKRLRDRGVVLAVCSANEESIAREVFERHPEMTLSLEDISCFVANWENKAANLEVIASTLNLGLESFVFVDDDPAQRSLVRTLLPQVSVPEMPKDPSEYVHAVESHRYFQLVSLGAEDLARTEYYRSNAEREQLKGSTETVDDFLASLKMRATIAPIGPLEIERCAQLINRSNQFNLTTRRRSFAELQALVDDDTWWTRAVSMRDRFGDSGLISVLLARRDGSVLELDTWVMSCRVLRRGVERLLFNHIARAAEEAGVERIRGEYIPTPKNMLVRDHYSNLGFDEAECGDRESTTWEVLVGEGAPSLRTFVHEETDG